MFCLPVLEDELPSIIVITGPTGGGKSRLAVSLAKRLGGEIINADSVQVYRDFDIGSCKPGREELEQVQHHLYSVIDPTAAFDAGIFRNLARDKIAELSSRGVLPFLVGGTGFYIRSLLCGLVPVGEITDRARTQLSLKEAEITGMPGDEKKETYALYEWLMSIDPDTAKLLSPSDLCRIRRALLVKLSTGKSLALLQNEHGHKEREYHGLVIALLPERERLYDAVNRRVDQILREGLVEETRKLRNLYPLNSRPFGAIGYRHVNLYLDGQLDYPEMVELLKRDTRRFAKKQMTWWRNQPIALGWRRIVSPMENGLNGDSREDISEHLEGVIKEFLQRKPVVNIETVAFLPVENVDVVVSDVGL